MLRTIHLGGSLAKYSRKSIVIDAPDIKMLMQGLYSMFGPRFKQKIRDGEWHITKKPLKNCAILNDSISAEEVPMTLSDAITEFWINPAIRARSAIIRIVVGVVLVVAGLYFKIPTLVTLGATLIIGGVTELLAPKPKTGQQSQSGQNPSFFFNGTVNVTEQGGPVPIVYGRVNRASSLVLSAGITTENIPPESNQRGV